MAFNFPDAPTLNERWPNPAVVGQPQYQWNGSEWTAAQFDPAGYVRRSGDSMTGALSLHGDPTEALHAVPKQYLDARTQRVSLAGGKSFDVQVPAGANAARLTGMILPGSATTISLYMHLSVAAGVFRSTVGDYSLYGYYHQTGTTPTAVTAFNGALTQPGMLVITSHTHASIAMNFNGMLLLKRPNTTILLSLETVGATYSGTSLFHSSLTNFLQQSAAGSALSVLAFRLMSSAGDNWLDGSYLNVEWM